MTTNEYLEPLWQAFERFADLPAVVDKDGRVTIYRALGELTRRIAGGLVQRQLPEHNGVSEEEQEFTRAAEEFYESYSFYSRRRRPMERH